VYHSTAPTTETLTTDPATTSPPTDDDDNTARNVGIGVGVGIGVLLLLMIIVLVIAFICYSYKRGKRHSKYVLNYNTVYGKDTSGIGSICYWGDLFSPSPRQRDALAHVGVEPYELSDNKGHIFAMAG
jgi:hypothetical protein